MTTTERVRVPRPARRRGTPIALLAAILITSIAGVSAHIVRGVVDPALATAFVSSPTATQDAPVKIMWVNQATLSSVDTGLRVVCFYAANTSPARADDPNWPRVTALGFEVPGALSGFTLLEPLDGEWELVEGGTAAIPGREAVTLDFAMISRVNRPRRSREGRNGPRGISPGQSPTRGTGTRFCVSGPFPDTLPNLSDPHGPPVATTIEGLINGVVVGFDRVQPHGPSRDVGLWESPQRFVPLYPE
jgi:hypothetical protein